MQNPTGVWCFFIQKMKSPLGSRVFRVSGNAKPHRGLSFFYPKNEIPTGVSGIQGVGKCKTPPGSGVFLSKKMESPPGSWAFRVSGSVKPHRGLVFFCPKNKIPAGVSDF